MSSSVPYDNTRPTTVGYNDPFGDGARDEPFSVDHLTHDDSRTFTTYTSGVPTVGLARPMAETGPTEAESLAAVYRQHNTSPSLSERLGHGRLPTPSPYESHSSNTSDPVIPYHDEDSYPSLRPVSVVEKADAPLMHNMADVGKSSTYEDLGMGPPIVDLHELLNIRPLEYADPPKEDPKLVSEKGLPFRSLLGTGKYPIEQRIEDKKRGIGRQKHPFVGELANVLDMPYAEDG
jgi:hypothetical protein